MRSRRLMSLLVLCVLLAAAGCGGGGDEGGDGGGDKTITFWLAEDVAQRVNLIQQIVNRFQTKSGVQVKVVAIAEDQLASQIQSASAAGSLPDVMGPLSLGFVQNLATDDLADADAANEVIDSLGRDTFSERALSLVESDGKPMGVPSDTWTQLLVYRKDLFEKAGLGTPDSLDKILDAATKLKQGGQNGIVAATKSGDSFTEQTFEYFALANGCQLTDDSGAIQLTSPQCVGTFSFYNDLIKNGSAKGGQDVDTTRAAYLAGKAAMIVWSSFLLDELAGLRNDALPTCPECRSDKRFLSKNSGVVTAISGSGGGEPTQFGEISNYVIVKDGNVDPAKQFVQFMMSDGYVDWLAIAPEGKVPVRSGTAGDPNLYAEAWAKLAAGVDRKEPLAATYPPEVLAAIAASPDSFRRWGFDVGQGQLAAVVAGQFIVPQSLALMINSDISTVDATEEAQVAAETVKSDLGV
jgi:multiple sugar transport system substrate-binding protein